MTLSEWIEAQATIRALWPHAQALDERALRLQHRLVVDVDREVALEAIAAHARSGAQWPPTPGQVAQFVSQAEHGEALSWTSAYRLVCRAVRKYGRNGEAEALRFLLDRSPHVAEFAAEYGWRRLCTEPTEDPDHGGAVLQRLERAYLAHCRQVDRDLVQGRVPQLAARRAVALESGDRGPAGGLRRLDLVAVLPERVGG